MVIFSKDIILRESFPKELWSYSMDRLQYSVARLSKFFFQLEQRIKQAFLHYAHIFSQNKLPNVIALHLRCTFS